MNLDLQFLSVPAVMLLAITATVLLVSHDWRFGTVALALQYLGVFILTTQSWPLEMAMVKLVAGWISGAVLGMALGGLPDELRDEARLPFSGFLFRLLAAALVIPVVYTLAPVLNRVVPGISVEQAFGGLTLTALGLLQLGLTVRTLRVAFGLLTVLAGFEILYAAVEFSTLVTGLLAGLNLGLALICAYLISAPAEEPEEEGA